MRKTLWKAETLQSLVFLAFCALLTKHLQAKDTSRRKRRGSPGGPVAKILHSQCREAWVGSLVRELDPTCTTKKILHATTKTLCSQIKYKKKGWCWGFGSMWSFSSLLLNSDEDCLSSGRFQLFLTSVFKNIQWGSNLEGVVDKKAEEKIT